MTGAPYGPYGACGAKAGLDAASRADEAPRPDHPDLTRLAGAGRSRVADLVSTVLDPAWCVVATLAVVSVASTTTLLGAAAWTLLSAFFCVGVPMLMLAALLRRGLVLDRHVVVREQRRLPLVGALGSFVVGTVVLLLAGAPAGVLALVVAMVTGLVLMTLVSLRVKASFHVGVTAGSVVVLGLVLGWPWGLGLSPLVAVAGWARVRGGRHTALQVVLGLVIGALCAALVFPVVVRWAA